MKITMRKVYKPLEVTSNLHKTQKDHTKS